MEISPGPRIAEGRVATVHAWGSDKVLKLAREWVPGEWIEHEFMMASTVFDSGVSSPRPFELIRVQGRLGIVYQFIPGVPFDTLIVRRPWRFAAHGRTLARIHSGLHTAVATESLPEVRDRLAAKLGQAEGAPRRILETALDSMRDLPGGASVLHGDFHPGNVLMAPEGPVVIDWPDAARGHPLADVARTVVLGRIGGLPAGAARSALQSAFRRAFLRSYLRSYFTISPGDGTALRRWMLPVLVARLSEGIESEYETTIEWATALIEAR